jgi:hypothetical protein
MSAHIGSSDDLEHESIPISIFDQAEAGAAFSRGVRNDLGNVLRKLKKVLLGLVKRFRSFST